MLKKDTTFPNPFTDALVTETHHFHLSKAALIEMQIEHKNEPPVNDPATGRKLEGFAAKLQTIINGDDIAESMVVIKDLIRRSYGKKDGDNFLRGPEIWANFEASGAFSQLYFELCTNAETQADFMNAIMPSDLMAQAVAALEPGTGDAMEKLSETPPTPEVEASKTPTRVLTMDEASELDPDELQSGLATGKYKLG